MRISVIIASTVFSCFLAGISRADSIESKLEREIHKNPMKQSRDLLRWVFGEINLLLQKVFVGAGLRPPWMAGVSAFNRRMYGQMQEHFSTQRSTLTDRRTLNSYSRLTIAPTANQRSNNTTQ